MEIEEGRVMFRRPNGGGWDFKRLLENSIPVVLTGLFFFYSTTLSTGGKVDGLTAQLTKMEAERAQMQAQVAVMSERLIMLQAQMTAFIGQQTTLNAAMDARLTYQERSPRGR